MLIEIISLLLDVAFYLFGSLVLLRFWLQKSNAHRYVRLPKEFFSLSNWLILPLRKIIPGYKQTDWASLLALLISSVTYSVLLLMLKDITIFKVADPLTLMTIIARDGIFNALLLSIQLMSLTLLGMVAISWLQPHSKLHIVLSFLCAPILAPIRKILPQSSSIDFSPMLALLGMQILSIILKSLLISI